MLHTPCARGYRQLAFLDSMSPMYRTVLYFWLISLVNGTHLFHRQLDGCVLDSRSINCVFLAGVYVGFLLVRGSFREKGESP